MKSLTITLLSDLGLRDTSVAMLKATLLRYAPGAAIIDVSHYAPQFDLQQAAYIFSAAYPCFPKGAIHVLPVDVFRGNAPRMLVAEKEGHFFIAPDNGILPMILGGDTKETRLCFEFEKPYIFNEWANAAGRAIDKLAIDKGVFGFPLCEIKKTLRVSQPKDMPDGVECNILYIDRYENVALDITRAQFDSLVSGRPFKIKITRTQAITKISNSYNAAGIGDPLCLFNAAGYLEIALNHDKAATMMGLAAYHTGNLQYQTIKISF